MMWPGLKTATPKSRGSIVCDACFCDVEKGIQYRRDTWKDGTYHWTCRYCPDCWDILGEIQGMFPNKVGPWAPQFEAWADTNTEDPRAAAWRLRANPEGE